MYSTNQFETFYRILRDISTSVHSSTKVMDVMDLAVMKCTEALEAKGTLLRVLNLETNQLELSAAYGFSPEYLAKGPGSSRKIITEQWKLNKPSIIEDIQNDPRIMFPREAWAEGVRMVLDVPLSIGSNIVGIIRVCFPGKKQFNMEQLDFVMSIGEQCAVALEKARLFEAQQSRYDHLVLQTEKMSALGRMAAGVAHEINNPLASILLFSSNLIKKVPPEGRLKEGLEIIIQETMRCRRIIQELLEFSRSKGPQMAPSSLNEAIKKALTILENEFRIHHIVVEKALDGRLPDVFMDIHQMEQVFVNLLINAVEAIGEEGRITVRSWFEPRAERVMVEITDTGSGILPKNLEKIFEPFFSTKPKGTGLGLAVSYGIIQNHQGTIQATSRLGQGTNFTIELPLKPKDSSADALIHEEPKL